MARHCKNCGAEGHYAKTCKTVKAEAKSTKDAVKADTVNVVAIEENKSVVVEAKE